MKNTSWLKGIGSKTLGFLPYLKYWQAEAELALGHMEDEFNRGVH